MDVTLRALTPGDIPAWAALLTAVERVDRTGDHYDAGDLVEEMGNPEVEVGKDFVGAFVANDLVGYFSVLPRGATANAYKVQVEGAVRPDVRGCGVGTVLASAMVDRAVEAGRERRPDLAPRITASGLSANAEQAALLGDLGMRPERWEFGMRVQLDRLPSPQAHSLAPGYQLRPFEPALDDAVFAAHNAAFLDHLDFTPWSPALWQQFVTGSRAFRPHLSFVAVRSGTRAVAAYLQTDEYDGYEAATGRREAYVGKLGTLREDRGRGLASSLLARALAAYRDAGYDEASLHVDSQNPTGALGIYQRAGFEVHTRLTSYGLTLRP